MLITPRLRCLALFAAIVTAACGCALPAPSKSPSAPSTLAEARPAAPKVPVRLRLVISAVTGSVAGVYTALEAGYFQDENIDLQIIRVDSSSRAIPVLLSGEAEFSTLDGQTIIQADLTGADLRAVAATTNHLVFSIMAAPSIKTPDDLRGKRLGITSLASTTNTAARQALSMWSLEPGKDVTLVPLNSTPNILLGLQANQVDAGVVSPPTNTRARLSGFHELINLATDGPEFPSLTIGSTQTFLSKNPQVALAFVRAYSRGLHRFKADQALAVQAMSKYLELDDRAVLEDTWEQFVPYFEDVPYVSRRGVQNAIDTVAQTMPEAVGTTPEQFVDSSFVRQLEEAGFYKQPLGGS